MLKIYGSEICSGCRSFKALMQSRGIEGEWIDITESVANLRAFLRMRDTNPIFDEIRKEGRIGIPVFVNDAGEITLNEDTALAWIGQPPAGHPDDACESCR